jgi:hypothetical protein
MVPAKVVLQPPVRALLVEAPAHVIAIILNGLGKSF